jgi:hypothetical protein
MRRRGVVGRYCQFVATGESFRMVLVACWRHDAMMNNEKVPMLQGSAAQIQAPTRFLLFIPPAAQMQAPICPPAAPGP